MTDTLATINQEMIVTLVMIHRIARRALSAEEHSLDVVYGQHGLLRLERLPLQPRCVPHGETGRRARCLNPLLNVRYRVNSGKHLLAVSISAFDRPIRDMQ